MVEVITTAGVKPSNNPIRGDLNRLRHRALSKEREMNSRWMDIKAQDGTASKAICPASQCGSGQRAGVV